MIRSVYRFIIYLHPPAFRKRFSEEMMGIFDEAAGHDSSALLFDSVASFARRGFYEHIPGKY